MNRPTWPLEGGEMKMKKMLMMAVVAAQIVATAQPAIAAELVRDGANMPSQTSAFAGARVRVPLGGRNEKPQAGLALTSTLRSGATGEIRFAKGAELGFSGGDSKVRLSLAGTPVSRLAPGAQGPQGRKQGVSTIGWVAIGVGFVALVFVALVAACSADNDCPPSE
jgi:hypothetical protein